MAISSHPGEVSSSVDPGGISGDTDAEILPLTSTTDSETATCQSEELTVDDVLTKHVGNFGVSQAVQFVLLASAWSVEAFQTLVMVFADREPAWRCTSLPAVPHPLSSFSATNSSFSAENLSFSVLKPSLSAQDLLFPTNNSPFPARNLFFSGGNLFCSGMNLFFSGGSLSFSEGNLSYMVECRPGVRRCELQRGQWEWVEGKGSSTVRAFGMDCGEEWKVGLAGAVFFLGYLISASMYGSFSDGYLGRKYTLLLASSLAVFFGLLTSLAPNFWIYVILRACTGFGCGGIGLVAFVLATEPVGPTLRGRVAISSNYFFSLGIILLSIMAYFIRDWRVLYVTSTVPTLVLCLLVLTWAKESPRWLLVHGKKEKALEVLRQFAEGNGRRLPKGINLVTELGFDKTDEVLIANDPMKVQKIDFIDSKIETLLAKAQDDKIDDTFSSKTRHPSQDKIYVDIPVNEEDKFKGGNLTDIFLVSETRKRILIMVYMWFTCAVVYYCLSLSTGSLGTNIYLTTFISGFVEFPGYFVSSIFIEKVGRKITFISMMTISSVSLLSVALTEFSTHDNTIPHVNLLNNDDLTTRAMIRLVFAIAGKFAASSCYAIAYVYTLELFPTVVRNVALGLTTQAAQCGGILAPIIVAFGRGNPPFPFLVSGIIALIAVSLGFHLSETLNQPLLETMDSFLREKYPVG